MVILLIVFEKMKIKRKKEKDKKKVTSFSMNILGVYKDIPLI